MTSSGLKENLQSLLIKSPTLTRCAMKGEQRVS